MTSEKRQFYAEKLETALSVVWALTLFAFPLFVTTFVTDPFVLAKELLLAGVVLLSLLAWGVSMLLQGQVRIRRTPLDIPVLLFTAAVVLSSVFAGNRADSLISSAGVIFAALSYFVLTNAFRLKKVAMLFVTSLVSGTVLASVITLLAHYKVYVLPFTIAKQATFSPLGTYTEFAMYALILLPLALHFVTPALKRQFTSRVGVFAVAAVALLGGLIVVGVALATTQKPILLPFDTGFQIAFAAISQDSARLIQTFLFGEGYGTFASVFSRFHNAAFNANQQLWFLSFSNSSSFLLELLATTGLVGALSYLFLIYKTLVPVAKKKANPYFLSLVVLFVVSAVLPFSFIEVALLFFLLAGFTLSQRETKPHEYFDIELQFVALKKGVFSFTTLDGNYGGRADTKPTPIAALVVLIVLVVFLGYYTVIYAASDVLFQKSLVAAANNNGSQAYQLQAQAVSMFNGRSDYYRIFSQTNIALANSLFSLNNGKPNASQQQTALALVQQGITTARLATTLSPLSSTAWQNLSSVYRALLGVGQNAQDFAIQAAQQATVLDSADPQEYINLGGIYYQLGQYDNAIRMFSQAAALKNDYANAYYNLGHAYEQKGDLQNALAAYQVVQNLVKSDQTNEQQITKEIAALQAKMGKAGSETTQQTANQTQQPQQQLGLPTGTQLPAQPTQVPLVSPTPSK